MALLSKAVRDVLRGRIQDPDTGINARLQDVKDSYTSLPVPKFDFAPGSRQYIESAISSDSLDMSGYNVYPRLLLYATSNEQLNLRKGALFSGYVVMTMEYHISFPTNNTPVAADEQTDMIEEATLLMLDDMDLQDWNSYGPPGTFVGWNANFTCSRSTVVLGRGESWLQILRFLLRFEVDVTS